MKTKKQNQTPKQKVILNSTKDFFQSIIKTNKLFFTKENIGIHDVTLNNQSQSSEISIDIINFLCYSYNGVLLINHKYQSDSQTEEEIDKDKSISNDQKNVYSEDKEISQSK